MVERRISTTDAACTKDRARATPQRAQVDHTAKVTYRLVIDEHVIMRLRLAF